MAKSLTCQKCINISCNHLLPQTRKYFWVYRIYNNNAENVNLQLFCEDDIEESESVLFRADEHLVLFQAHQTIKYFWKFSTQKTPVRRSCRPALRLVAQGSVRAEEGQDRAKDQGSPLCWRGRWLGWTPQIRSWSPPCNPWSQPGQQIWRLDFNVPRWVPSPRTQPGT